MLSDTDVEALCRLFDLPVPFFLPRNEMYWAPWAITYLRTLQNWSA